MLKLTNALFDILGERFSFGMRHKIAWLVSRCLLVTNSPHFVGLHPIFGKDFGGLNLTSGFFQIDSSAGHILA